MTQTIKAIKFYSTSDTHGYAVERFGHRYVISYVKKVVIDGGLAFEREGYARSRGVVHAYASPFNADFILRKLILPMYHKTV